MLRWSKMNTVFVRKQKQMWHYVVFKDEQQYAILKLSRFYNLFGSICQTHVQLFNSNCFKC